MPAVLTAPVDAATVYQSRWGWHPCDCLTSLKLRSLAAAARKAQRQAAAFNRWERKQPQNRVTRERIRSAGRMVIGYGPPVPLPAPRVYLPFGEIEGIRAFALDPATGRYANCGPVVGRVAKLTGRGAEVIAAAKAARTPAPSPGEVKPLPAWLTPAKVDRLLESCG